MTPEIRPSWAINCSQCGAVLVERRGFTPPDGDAGPEAEEVRPPT